MHVTCLRGVDHPEKDGCAQLSRWQGLEQVDSYASSPSFASYAFYLSVARNFQMLVWNDGTSNYFNPDGSDYTLCLSPSRLDGPECTSGVFAIRPAAMEKRCVSEEDAFTSIAYTPPHKSLIMVSHDLNQNLVTIDFFENGASGPAHTLTCSAANHALYLKLLVERSG